MPDFDQELLLENKVASEPVHPVDAYATHQPLAHQGKCLRKARSVVKFLRAGDALVGDHSDDLVVMRPSPRPNRLLLDFEAKPFFGLLTGGNPDVGDHLHDLHLVMCNIYVNNCYSPG